MRMMMLAAALALPSAAVAQSAKSCLPPAQAEALITFALPSLVRGVTKHCAKTLPPTASLVQSGPLIASRYQIEADRAWPGAREAVDMLAGMKISETLGEAGARGMLETVFETELAGEIKPKDCPVIESVMRGLEPLPAKNISMIVVAVLQVSTKADKKDPFNICPAPAASR